MAVAATAALCSATCAAAPLEIYGKLPFVEQIAISPDGATLAMAVTNGEDRRIILVDADTLKIGSGLFAGNVKVRGMQWAGSHHLIIIKTVTADIPWVEGPRREYAMAVDLNIAQHTLKPLLADVEQSLNVVYGGVDVRLIAGKPVAFVEGQHFVAGQGQFSLFRVDLESDKAIIAAEGFSRTLKYVVDAHGQALAEGEYDPSTDRTTLKLFHNRWREVARDKLPQGDPTIRGLGRDGASLLVNFEKDHQDEARELSPDGATWSDPLPDWATGDLIYDGSTHKLIGGYKLIKDEGRYTFADPAMQAHWEAIKRAYPGSIVSLQSFSDDLSRVVVKVQSPVDPPAYALVDIKTKHAKWIANQYEGLAAGDMNPVTPVAFKARDGLDLTGYLTLPIGRPAKGLPLVVFPHGGPHSRDEPGFDWWAQAMGSRGYAVLQVNFRGSSGLGWAFQAKGFGEFGRKMQTDLSDGVRYLAGQGTIDPARVCIVGASYGGYAALAGATLDPGVYRCAASVAGISDLRKMLTWDNARDPDGASDTTRFWTRYMGEVSTLGQISPIAHIDKVSIPILLAHGKDDTVVAYQQSLIMADALAKAGKPYQLVTLKAEDHWLSRGATRLEMLQAVVGFLEKYNPPGQ